MATKRRINVRVDPVLWQATNNVADRVPDLNATALLEAGLHRVPAVEAEFERLASEDARGRVEPEA